MVAVKKAGKWGFINKEGKNVIPCQYDKVASFREGLVAVVKNGKSGYINTKGKEIVPFIYDKPEIGNRYMIFMRDLLLLERMVLVAT